ncbi:MAG: ABC transporter permease [Chitinophagaceae bacterium]|nr:MAG: ABC transporter permease [Chitinophagaceae bacterium]
MIKNYLKVALRYLRHHKAYTIINVSGLGVGIACCILIALFVKSEWSFDRFHSKADRIHRAWLQEFYEGQIFTNTVTPIPLGPVLQNSLPEIEKACRVFSTSPLVRYQNNVFTEKVNMVDSSFFNIFDFELRQGDIDNPFPTVNAIIITQAAAAKYFGRETAIGKTIELELAREWVPFTVAGVVDAVPLESSLQFQMLISFANGRRFFSEKAMTQAWSNVTVETYFLLKKGVEATAVNKKIATVLNPLVTKNYKPGEYNVSLQKLTAIHLDNNLPAGNEPVSNPKYSTILATIGILILLTACINFVTLSIGRSTTRSLEVGVRKVLGAARHQLVRQFWGEALLLTFVSFVMGFCLAMVCLKPFNQLADRELVLGLSQFTIIFFLGLFITIGLIAGIYPAIILSGFRPIEVLKGKLKTGGSLNLFRKALVVSQFVASIIMIICTVVIGKQLNYLRSKDLGFQKENVIVISTNKGGTEGRELASRLRTALETKREVKSSTTSWFSMIQAGWMKLGYLDDRKMFRSFSFNIVDPEFIPTMGLQLVSGRNFMKENPADSNAIIVNEALVKEYGWKDPIGKKLPGKYTELVIGVVKDFNFESLHTSVKPVVMAMKSDSIFGASSDVSSVHSNSRRVTVRLVAGDLTQQLAGMRSAWKSVAGTQDFEFRFLDDALNAAYSQEQRLGNIVTYASVLSIFIACMGLFGLATLVVVKRTKEIGIRKVLGADVKSIITLLSKDFLVLVLVAILVAFPVAWWALSDWLKDFSYRINIPLWVFFGAAAASLAVALITVSLQTIRAALSNPVNSLKSE